MPLFGLSDNAAMWIFPIQVLNFVQKVNASKCKAFLYFVFQQLSFLTVLGAHITFYSSELTFQSSNLPEKANYEYTPPQEKNYFKNTCK